MGVDLRAGDPVVYIVIALWEAQYSPWLVIVLVSVSSAYLAWHYTGQVWGMMASYAYLDGARSRSGAFSHPHGPAHPARVARHVVPVHAAARSAVVRPVYLVISAGTARRVRARRDRASR